MNDPFQHFVEVAKRDGMAASSTNDGYILLFMRGRLQSLLLNGLGPAVVVGINTEGTVRNIQMGRDRLQSELDAHPDQPMIIIVYTHAPVKN